MAVSLKFSPCGSARFFVQILNDEIFFTCPQKIFFNLKIKNSEKKICQIKMGTLNGKKSKSSKKEHFHKSLNGKIVTCQHEGM